MIFRRNFRDLWASESAVGIFNPLCIARTAIEFLKQPALNRRQEIFFLPKGATMESIRHKCFAAAIFSSPGICEALKSQRLTMPLFRIN
ncbi:hypothetical protein CDAR_318991 [Caerostris darwini]|uniref:Uncharacterized protein n=1 Tax=Caerostris darwini TaxID=1538125 RepID=A0AAV4TXL2_9ARAC|nr:hypothetical protein CDAR_318991 [Caerostris darwini]